MQEKDYCEKCDLYTRQKENEKVTNGVKVEEWVCPVCESCKTYKDQ